MQWKENRVDLGRTGGFDLLKREQRTTAASEHAGHGCRMDTPLIRALYRAPASACEIAAAVTAVLGVKILLLKKSPRRLLKRIGLFSTLEMWDRDNLKSGSVGRGGLRIHV